VSEYPTCPVEVIVKVPLAAMALTTILKSAVPELDPPELYSAQTFTVPPTTVIVPVVVVPPPPVTGISPDVRS
jgi:hypothetical protein